MAFSSLPRQVRSLSLATMRDGAAHCISSLSLGTAEKQTCLANHPNVADQAVRSRLSRIEMEIINDGQREQVHYRALHRGRASGNG